MIFLIGVRHVSDTGIKGGLEKEGNWRVVVGGGLGGRFLRRGGWGWVWRREMGRGQGGGGGFG